MQFSPLSLAVALSLGICLASVATVRAQDDRPAGVPDDARPPGAAVQTSDSCARCHASAPDAAALRDEDGHTVAPYDLWSSTMMANASRDPLWLAAVSIEVAATPAARAAIETKCLSCHAPMAHLAGLEDRGYETPMDVLHDEGLVGDLARDGASCTVCHGIAPDNLGTPESFTAGFEIDPWNRLFGPHTEPSLEPMSRATGFTPTHGAHILDAALCGTCHTLETHALDADGTATGEVLLEQAPYLEWRTSAFSTEREREEGAGGRRTGHIGVTCQECHVPRFDAFGREIETRIARNPGGRDFPFVEERTPVGRHILVGGNTLVLGMLADHAEELGVTASPEALARSRAAALEQLTTRTASIGLGQPELEDGVLRFDVTVVNRTGHKLPTGHPTRRAFLRAIVRDAAGDVLFASGRTDERGRVLGSDGEPLPSERAGGPVQPHRDVATSPDELVEYRAVMADVAGEPTHLLMRGGSWFVDTRLLPRGFDEEHPDAPRVAPVGVDADENFTGGRDQVRFEVPIGGARPASIEVELCYQTLSARWADEMARYDTPEVRRFMRMYAEADLDPVVLAATRVEF